MQMTPLVTAVLSAFLGVGLVFVVFKSGILGFVYDVRTASTGLEFVLASKFVVGKMPYDNIAKVVDVPAGGVLHLMAYNFKNRSGTGCFLVRQKRSWFARSILITPRNRNDFIAALRGAGVPVEAHQ